MVNEGKYVATHSEVWLNDSIRFGQDRRYVLFAGQAGRSLAAESPCWLQVSHHIPSSELRNRSKHNVSLGGKYCYNSSICIHGSRMILFRGKTRSAVLQVQHVSMVKH